MVKNPLYTDPADEYFDDDGELPEEFFTGEVLAKMHAWVFLSDPEFYETQFSGFKLIETSAAEYLNRHQGNLDLSRKT
jgi:hypothetical protein